MDIRYRIQDMSKDMFEFKVRFIVQNESPMCTQKAYRLDDIMYHMNGAISGSNSGESICLHITFSKKGDVIRNVDEALAELKETNLLYIHRVEFTRGLGDSTGTKVSFIKLSCTEEFYKSL